MQPARWQPGSAQTVLETERLRLRWITLDDAPFFVELLNDAGYIEHILDRGVRTVDDARRYLESGPLASYAEHGYAMWLIERRSDGRALGNGVGYPAQRHVQQARIHRLGEVARQRVVPDAGEGVIAAKIDRARAAF